MTADRDAVRSRADGGGTAVWDEDRPGPLSAASVATFAFRFNVGPLGIARGGSITFQPPPCWGWSPPQTDLPNAPGYTVIVPSEPDAGFEVDASLAGSLRLVARDRPLRHGESVRIVYGAGDAAATVDRYVGRGEEFWFAVDGDGDGVRAWVADPPSVDVVAGVPTRLVTTLPSVVWPGESARMTLAWLDRYANAGAVWTGQVDVRIHGPATGPKSVRFTEDDEGISVGTLRALGEGIVWVSVAVDGEIVARTNPMLVRQDAPRVRWADLHGHSNLSDGTGTPEEFLVYARDVAGLDIVSLTDHDHWGMRYLDSHPGVWAEIGEAAARWNDPGRFVALLGYEYTDWRFGHRHVLYGSADGALWSAMNPDAGDPRWLWNRLAGSDVVTVPHHPAGGPVALDWRIVGNERVEPVVEICSVHGSSEATETPRRIHRFVPGHQVRAQLNSPRRWGFLCSSDGHDGHPGLAQLQGGVGGLAALETDVLDREGVLGALRARRVYGTNGPRILLRVEPGESGDQPATVRVLGTAPIDHVSVIGVDGVRARRRGGGDVVHHEFSREELGSGPWYVRVRQTDGGAAWSSPVYPGR